MPKKNDLNCFLNYVLFLFNVHVQLFGLVSCADTTLIPGHLKKLGSHREPFGVTGTGIFSKPVVFYRNFIHPGKPLLMKDVLKQVNHPGLTIWTDDFLKEHYGSEIVAVEPSKVEDRKHNASHQSLKDFITIYKEQDVYMIHSLRGTMKDLVFIPETLHCGGFQNVLQDAVMWLGSGETSSVLHRDPLDNLLCLLDGEKDIVLIDKTNRDEVESHGFEQQGGYSHVDPLSVDMEAFPHFRNLIWHEARLQKGDCLFIPENWYHQVTSHGTRHMSINIWFAHLNWFNRWNCSDIQTFYKPLEPVATFGFASPNEIHRSNLLRRFKGKGILTKELFWELLPNSPTRERSDEFFESINEYQDPVLSWGELYLFDIDQMLMKFPDLFDLTGEPYVDDKEDQDRFEETANDASKEQREAHLRGGDISGKKPESDYEDSDSDVPLPDALSEDEILLPDDPAGQSPYYSSDGKDVDSSQKDGDTFDNDHKHSSDAMNAVDNDHKHSSDAMNESYQLKKDEL